MSADPRIEPGRVVYVYSRQDWLAGRVVQWRGGRGEVEHADGETETYPEKRLARVSDAKVPTRGALEAWAEQVAELRDAADLQSLWEMLADEEDADRPRSADELASLALPAAGPAADDAMAWALFRDQTWFKSRRDGRVAPNQRRVVEERLRQREAAEQAAAEERAMIAWLRDPQAGDSEAAAAVIERLQHLVLYEEATRTVRHARTIIAAAFPDTPESDEAIAWRLLLERGVWHADENMALLRSGLPRHWAPGVEEEAERLTAERWRDGSRVDLTDLEAVAVDDRFTTEVDDALALRSTDDGGYCVYVLIADPAAFVPLGSRVDNEARRRASTLYVPEGKIPMLPPCLSDEAASLRPGADRPATAFVLHLNAQARVVDFEVCLARVRVRDRLTYEEVDDILSGGEHASGDALRALAALADQLRSARAEGGAITLDRRERAVHLDDGVLHVEPYSPGDPARRLVSEWMIQTCLHAAAWCHERGVPTLYRSQPTPDPMPVLPADRPMEPHELHQVLRVMRKATLGLEPGRHAGLGVDGYTQVTSPLRRYADLVQHRQLQAALVGAPFPYSDEDLSVMIPHLEELQSLHGRVERESRRYWLLKRLQERLGETVEAVAVRPAGNRYLVELVDSGLTATIRKKPEFRPGLSLALRVLEVDPRMDRLVLGSTGPANSG